MGEKNRDHRIGQFLQEGDTIVCAGEDAVFRITGDPIGCGGSAVVYPAVLSSDRRLYAIKECFPNDPRFCRKNGIVAPADPADAQALGILGRYRSNLTREAAIGQIVSNTATRAVSIQQTLKPLALGHDGQRYTALEGAMFTVLERMDQKAVSFDGLLAGLVSGYDPEKLRRTRGMPGIHATAWILEEILIALKQVHDTRDPEHPGMTGYYYGDLHNGNVYFTESDPKAGVIGRAHLMDFGSARELDENGETEELFAEDVFSTKGFRPPEMFRKGLFRLTAAADIYSAGRLLLLCTATAAKRRPLKDGDSVPENFLDSADGGRIGCSGNALRLLNEILARSLQARPEDRYGSVDEMLVEIRQLKTMTAPPAYTMSRRLSAPEHFVPGSRDRELALLAEAMSRGETVYIWGMGGIGKTELAMELARRIEPARGSYLIRFQGSTRETILGLDFSGYVPPERSRMGGNAEAADLAARMEILRKHYSGALFVLDNFDCPGKTVEELRKEPEFQALQDMGIRLVVTTRSRISWQPQFELRELEPDSQLALVRHYYRDSTVSDALLRELIDEVGGHTLTLSLAARTLALGREGVTVRSMLEAIRENRLSRAQLPAVATDQNRTYAEGRIFQHLQAVFDLSGMTGAERSVMDLCAFLPQEGMALQGIHLALDEEGREARETLVRQGWLRQSDEFRLQIHPMIRELVREQIGRSHTGCDPLLQRLRENLEAASGEMCIMYGGVPKWVSGSLSMSVQRQVAAMACEAADFLEDPTGQRAWFAAWSLAQVHRFTGAKQYARTALERGGDLKAPLDLARHWRSAARCYYIIDWPLCLQYVQQECIQWDAILAAPGTDRRRFLPSYAEALFRGCQVCCLDFHYAVSRSQGREEAALEYGRKALEAAGSGEEPDLLLISQIHYLLSVVYGRMVLLGRDVLDGLFVGVGRHRKYRRMRAELTRLRMEQLELAFRANEQAGAVDDGWTALLYEARGNSRGREGREDYRKALALRQRMKASDPKTQAMLWDNIANLHEKLGERKKAVRIKMEKVRAGEDRWYMRLLERVDLWLNSPNRHPDGATLWQRSLLAFRFLATVALIFPLGLAVLAAMLCLLRDTILEARDFLAQELRDRRRTRE